MKRRTHSNRRKPPSIVEFFGVHLRHVTDDIPGIRRARRAGGFAYFVDGKRGRLTQRDRARIQMLAIPPAWTKVWICPYPNGHLQATGMDSRKRKQYRYHPHFRALRELDKFERTASFARALPAIRRRVARDLALPGLSRNKVLALIVRLLERTLIRIGNAEYAEENKSFGLTTMRDRHMKLAGADRVKFVFRGKSGIPHEVYVDDPRLARLVRKCQELPGQELFQYMDENKRVRDVTSTDVNRYLKDIAGREFTAKDFRTWKGTTLAALLLEGLREAGSEKQRKQNIVQVVKAVASELRNLPATCRKFYIHPAVLEAYLNGTLSRDLRKGRSASRLSRLKLSKDERGVLSVIEAASRT